MKELLPLILVAVMAAGVLSACAGSRSQITFPLAEQVEITIATEDGTVASLADNLPLWQEIQRRTNVKINWDVTAPAQYVEEMKSRINADEGDLPDVLLLPNGLSLGELGGKGIIIPLEDYIDEYGENIQSMYKRFPRAKSLTSADAHIYSIKTVNENAYFTPYGFAICKDWLDRLGLDEPETIDDWMIVLRAFRDEDADGDGDPNNEIYVKNVDGSYSFTKMVTANPDGLTAGEVLSSYGCQLGLPYIMSDKRGEAMLYEYDDDMRERFVTVSVKTRPYARSGLVLPPATVEESEIISGKSGDLATYVWEMTGKFIVGTEDIDEKWNSYVSHVKELGMDDILAVKQAQYDRLEN